MFMCVRVRVSEDVLRHGQMQMDADLEHDVSDSRPNNFCVASNFLLLDDVLSLLPIPSTLLHAHPYVAAKVRR